MTATQEDILSQNIALARKVAELENVVDRLLADNRLLKQALHRLGRLRPGVDDEAPGQLHFFGKDPEPPKPEAPSEEESPKKNGQRSTGRQAPPAHLQRVVVDIEPQESELACDCGVPGCQRVIMGHETCETIERTAARLTVKVTRRPKLACPGGQNGVLTPSPEPRIVDKCLAGDSLLIFVILQKYRFHVPLYRIARMIKAEGWTVAESTLCGWVHRVADALAPLVIAMKRWLLKQAYLQADETPAKARDPATKGKLKQIYFWVYSVPWKEMVFEYQTSRSGQHVREFLADFEGTALQVDEYSGYDAYFRENPGVVRLGCWAHAIRKFKEARKQGDRPEEAARLCHLISRMLRLETLVRARGLSDADRGAIRLRTHARRLDWIRDELDEALANPKIEPQSSFGKAVRYCHLNWENLTAFLSRSDVEMDNNGIEHGIRNVALGRKNWLHIGHIDQGDTAAIFYTLIVTCLRLNIEPEEYLTDVFRRLPSLPIDRVEELLPRQWRDARHLVAHPPQD